MNFLSRIKLRTKLVLLLGLSALALAASIGAGASLMHGRMVSDRIDKVHAVVLAAVGFAQSLQAQADAHQITQAQAVAAFRDDVHRMRFGAEDDYLLVQTFDGMVVMHGGDPAREGKPTASKDAKRPIDRRTHSRRVAHRGWRRDLVPRAQAGQHRPAEEGVLRGTLCTLADGIHRRRMDRRRGSRRIAAACSGSARSEG